MTRILGLPPDDLDKFLERVGDLILSIADRIRSYIAGLFADGTASDADLAQVRSRWSSAVSAEMLPALREVYEATAEAVVAGLADAGRDVSDLDSPDAAEFLSQARNRLVGVGTERWEAARAVLADGVRSGQDMEVLSGRVADAAQVTIERARVIACSEVLSAMNAASLAQARALADPTVIKEWLATIGDGRTRETHLKADGQRVRIGEKFKVGAALLDAPGDPSSTHAEETVSCRCSIAIDLDDDPTVAAAHTAFHPGHPSQKVHAGGRQLAGVTQVVAAAEETRTNGVDVSDWVDEDGAAAFDRHWMQGKYYDGALVEVATKQGFDGKPAVVDAETLNAAVREGWTEVWRGVSTVRNVATAHEINNAFRYGAYEPGRGVYGNGYYTSVRRGSAEPFTLGDTGGLVRIAINPKARIVDYEDLKKEMAVDPRPGNPFMGSLGDFLRDAGRFAAMRGYDAVQISGRGDGSGPQVAGEAPADQFLIVNRTAVMVQSEDPA